jgi:hypothetical protein
MKEKKLKTDANVVVRKFKCLATHTEIKTDEDGDETQIDYKIGDIIESPVDLVKQFPGKFELVEDKK